MDFPANLVLWCDAQHGNYRLSQEGKAWHAEFTSVEGAMEYARTLFNTRVEVVVTNETGETIYVTAVEPQSATSDSTRQACDALKKSLASKGLREAVKQLNSMTLHRFTSVYRFDGPTLRNVTFYDRQNPEVNTCEEIPVAASYCVFLRDTGKSFSTGDAAYDERVRHHPKRDTVRRYCGVPIFDETGNAFGSICHFDFEAGQIADGEVELLQQMASLIQPSL